MVGLDLETSAQKPEAELAFEDMKPIFRKRKN